LFTDLLINSCDWTLTFAEDFAREKRELENESRNTEAESNSRLRQLQLEIDTLRQQNAGWQRDVQIKSEEIEELMEENEALRKKLIHVQQEAAERSDELMDEHERLLNLKHKLETENEKLKQQLVDTENQLKVVVCELEKERMRLKVEMEKLETKTAAERELRIEIEGLVMEKGALSVELDELRMDFDSGKRHRARIEEENKRLREQLENVEMRERGLRTEVVFSTIFVVTLTASRFINFSLLFIMNRPVKLLHLK